MALELQLQGFQDTRFERVIDLTDPAIGDPVDPDNTSFSLQVKADPDQATADATATITAPYSDPKKLLVAIPQAQMAALDRTVLYYYALIAVPAGQEPLSPLMFGRFKVRPRVTDP